MDNTFYIYNALDSACMLEIHNSFWQQLEEKFSHTYRMTSNLFPVLQFMQMRGMKVDHTLLRETRDEITKKRDQRQKELDELVGYHLNVNSSKQCCDYFYIKRGLPAITNPKTHSITADDKAMQRLVRGTAKHPSIPEAKLVQEIRGYEKLYNTYLNAVFDDDGRLRGSYNPRGTKFGRLSSSKTIRETGLNYQNIPQEFKKFLVADEGYILLEADKRQAEWVVVAYAANDANMIQAIEKGLDVHSHTASLMFNLPIEVIKYEQGIIGHSSNAEEIFHLRSRDQFLSKIYTSQWPRTMSLRQCGKKSNHGLNYDEGPNNFALINEMEIPEARRIVEMYHSIYPGIRKFYEEIKGQIKKNRTLTNCFGRKVVFLGDFCKDTWKAAYSMLPQSTVVDCVNNAMVAIYNDTFLTKDLNLDVLAQIHDSILIQIPKSSLDDIVLCKGLIEKIDSYMTPTLSYHGNEFKIATDFKIGLNWGEYNSETNQNGMVDCKNAEFLYEYLEKQKGTVHEGT